MAGIYIPNMKMPNKKNGTVIIIYPQGVVMGEDHTLYQAITIPDHGRLIDEVRLNMQIETAKEIQKNEQKDFCNAFINNGKLCTEWWCVEDMIENAPTIIPADMEETK